ncbi:MAG: hypothetical protein HWQ38_34290 [Nostoc sp. NMS7]|uniref:hypothetical protein n=1 Tax=Nostoc sp. NMS7 TaxID=2815391 RepID=UPI0025FEFBF6|nr:hypothetical protein [Nostoc sp. NMS7]MBN3951272.1 hypothetical protein [Nostoc sp. NMS7]
MRENDLDPQDGLSIDRVGSSYITERLIPKSQLREAIREILAEMLGVNTTTPQQSQREWYDTNPAYRLLGLSSSKQLRKMVADGILRVGRDDEVRDVRSPDAKLPHYQFHLTKCEARLATPPVKRKGRKAA